MAHLEAHLLPDLIDHHAGVNPDHPAIHFGDDTISYGDFHRDVDRAARMLGGLGMGRGERLALMFPNRPEMLILYFACFRLGLVVVPINTRYKRQEIEYALDHSECRMLVADESFYPTVEGLEQTVPSLERIVVRHNEDEHHERALHVHLANAPETVEYPETAADDPAVIFYTSGSTSRPKGVVHTHSTLLANARTQIATREVSADTVWLVCTGVGYIAGLSGVTMPAFMAGCTLVLVEELAADNLLRATERHGAHTALLLPTMMLEMLESPLCADTDLSSLKACFVAGDEASHDLYQRFRERLGHDLLQAFGMTECEGFLSNRSSGPSRKGTIGIPAEGIEVRLVDGDGNEVGPGEPGEITVRGPSVMVGYWEDPDHTAETLKDGWLYGGDIATRDEDGFFKFHERGREIIIHGGSNVGPHEVEDVIDSHPAVKESCVVGVPDTLYGALLAAYVVWEEEDGEEVEALKAWLADRLADYKVPDRWKVMGQLPKTATGKIDRHALHAAADKEWGS